MAQYGWSLQERQRIGIPLMDRRSFLLRATAIATAAALPLQRVTTSNAAQATADRIAALGFTVTRVGSQLVSFNVWQPVSDEESNAVGWVMHDGSVRWLW